MIKFNKIIESSTNIGFSKIFISEKPPKKAKGEDLSPPF